jgi:hypothetical protein
MIVDGHAYCFPPMGEANGFHSAEEHLRYVQREMADHHQPVWRLADRAPGDNAMLADPADRTLAGLRQVGFRAGGYGRFVWTVNGQPYAKQYLPPYLADLSHTPEMLVAQSSRRRRRGRGAGLVRSVRRLRRAFGVRAARSGGGGPRPARRRSVASGNGPTSTRAGRPGSHRLRRGAGSPGPGRGGSCWARRP